MKVFWKNWPILFIALIFVVVVSLGELAVAHLLGVLVDQGDGLVKALVMLVALLLLNALCQYAYDILFNRYAVGIQSELRRRIGESMTLFSEQAALNTRTGDMLVRANTDVASVFEFINNDLSRYIQGIVSLIFGIGYLFKLQWRLALFVIVGCVVLIVVTYLFNLRIAKAHRKWRKTQGEMSVVAQDIAAGQLDIKAMGIEKSVLERFYRSVSIWEDAFYKRNNIRAWNRATSILFSVIVFVGIPAVSAGMVVAGEFTIGMVLSAIQAARMVSSPLQSVEFLMSNITGTKINFSRVQELLNLDKERKDGSVKRFNAEVPVVELNHVSFGYGQEQIINDVSFKVAAGEKVAIVGASGSGKTTVLKLLTGLYETKGVRIGGSDLHDWDLQEVRKHMAYVQQNAFLFPGTIKENLCCGIEYSDAELKNVIRMAGLDEWIDHQPQGWNMEVGEIGSKLSGGLVQRVSIARALLRKPTILLMDEPTAALDKTMEGHVSDMIRNELPDMTCIIVAHRLSSITFADQIFVMNEGKIVEKGTHEELMALRGYYFALYSLQNEEE